MAQSSPIDPEIGTNHFFLGLQGLPFEGPEGDKERRVLLPIVL